MDELIDFSSRHHFNISDFKADGNCHRFDRNGKKNAWYVLFENEPNHYVMLLGDWKTGEEHKFISSVLTSKSEKRFLDRKILEARKRQKETKVIDQLDSAKHAEGIWKYGREEKKSTYYERKQISELYGTRSFIGRFGYEIAVPMRDIDNKFWGVQKISQDGSKRFLTGQKINETFHQIGEIKSNSIIFFAEGFATAASIHQATQEPVVITFTANNLPKVAKIFKGVYSANKFIIAGDDDRFTTLPDGQKRNPGREKALEASKITQGKVCFPVFKSLEGNPTDFNDLYCLEGETVVQQQLICPLPVLDPELIPEPLRNWVVDAAKMIYCPIEYIAFPALGALSALIGPRLRGKPCPYSNFAPPTLIWTMGVGAKGTRKTAGQSFATKYVQKIDIELEDKYKKLVANTEKEVELLTEKRNQIKKSIKKAKGDTDELFEELEGIEDKLKQLTPVKEYFTCQDSTTAAMVHIMQSAPYGIISILDELGYLFSMFGKEHSQDMRNFSLVGWNASGVFKKILKTEGETSVKNPSLTYIGMVQPSVFQKAFTENKDIIDDGFLDRFQLIFFPEDLPAKRRENLRISPQDEFRAQSIFKDAFYTDYSEFGESEEHYKIVPFEDDAMEYYLDKDFEANLQAEKQTNHYMMGWWRKSPRTIISLSVVFYVIDRVSGIRKEKTVAKHHVELAWKWIEYTSKHAGRAYALI